VVGRCAESEMTQVSTCQGLAMAQRILHAATAVRRVESVDEFMQGKSWTREISAEHAHLLRPERETTQTVISLPHLELSLGLWLRVRGFECIAMHSGPREDPYQSRICISFGFRFWFSLSDRPDLDRHLLCDSPEWPLVYGFYNTDYFERCVQNGKICSS
jgi:hypothetical protein